MLNPSYLSKLVVSVAALSHSCLFWEITNVSSMYPTIVCPNFVRCANVGFNSFVKSLGPLDYPFGKAVELTTLVSPQKFTIFLVFYGTTAIGTE